MYDPETETIHTNKSSGLNLTCRLGSAVGTEFDLVSVGVRTRSATCLLVPSLTYLEVNPDWPASIAIGDHQLT